jgi:hypothetical protein
MTATARIAAARAYAPPLVIVEAFDKRGAKLRQVNQKAVGYAQRAGLALEDVYPGALATLRLLAPPAGSPEAIRFAMSVGVPLSDLYPAPATASGEDTPRLRRRRWAWIAAGLVLGAISGGVSGLLTGGVVGALVGART